MKEIYSFLAHLFYINPLILKYQLYRNDFINLRDDILFPLEKTDRDIFIKYINIELIDIYFNDLKLLFYTTASNNFLDKDEFNRIHGKFRVLDSDSEFSKLLNLQVLELVELKEMIISLNGNILSNFLLPIIYNLLSEEVSISKRDLDKLKYLLLNIFSKNYSEYKQIFMFFNQLEVFLNYDGKNTFFDKLKVGFSLFLLSVLFFVFGYYYLPIGVFLGLMILAFIKSFEISNPESYFKMKLNLGLKFFAILFISISGYFWLQNMDEIKSDAESITKTIEVFGKLETKYVFEEGMSYIKTNILEYGYKK